MKTKTSTLLLSGLGAAIAAAAFVAVSHREEPARAPVAVPTTSAPSAEARANAAADPSDPTPRASRAASPEEDVPEEERNVPPKRMEEIRAFARALAKASCEGMGRCCSDNGHSFDRARCEAEAERTERSLLAQVWGRDDRAQYDARAAAECLTAKRAEVKSCGEVGERDAERAMLACERVFTKNLRSGERCESRADCATASGQRTECEAPAGSADPVCVTTSTPRAGSACDPSSQACEEEGLRCDVASRTCQPRLGVGGACGGAGDCADGFYCAGLTPPEEPPPGADGEHDEPSGHVNDVARPGATGRCERSLRAGTSCAAYGATCENGSYCDGERCVPRGAPGAKCVEGTQCLSGVCGPRGTCLRNWVGSAKSCGKEES